MGNSFPTGGFGPGANTESMWQVMEHLRSTFDKRSGGRVGRGDVRAAVLALLSEQPMHGYQIIREIEKRSGGSWKPSAGSVYPTLQLLADEGLISAQESNGRKTYDLTDAAHDEADAAAESAPWGNTSTTDGPTPGALAKAGVDLAQAVAQIARTGTPEQSAQAVSILNDTRRRLYSILAED